MSAMIYEAIQDTIRLHKNQLRKFTLRPYWEHPIRVMSKVVNHAEFKNLSSYRQDVVAVAAVGHDWIEDTTATPEWAAWKYGKDICDLILELTDEYTKEKYPHLNREARKYMEHNRLRDISEWARKIKIADRLDNLGELDYNDVEFAKLYLNESLDLAEALDSLDIENMVEIYMENNKCLVL